MQSSRPSTGWWPRPSRPSTTPRSPTTRATPWSSWPISSPGGTGEQPVKVVVVGAGLGGLSAACHIAGRGHDVEVLELGDVPGGRAGLWETGGQRLGHAGGGLTMLGILRGAFEAAGADMDSMLTLK